MSMQAGSDTLLTLEPGNFDRCHAEGRSTSPSGANPFVTAIHPRIRGYIDRSPADRDSTPSLLGRLPSLTKQLKTTPTNARFWDKDLESIPQKDRHFVEIQVGLSE
jgi:hypothetical protein